MNSSASPQVSDPNDALAARADEQLARVTEQLSKMERDAVRPSPAAGRVSPHERPAFRGAIALLMAACIVGAAFLLQSPYGNAARLMVARWTAQIASTLPLQKPVVATQPGPSTVQPVAADAAAARTMTASTETPPTAAAPPELIQLLRTVETMARDLADVEQGIAQLKANQTQMASENANALDQLRIRQEEMTGLIGKVFDQTLRITSAASAPPTPVARKPVQAPRGGVPSQQARALPRAPVQQPQ